MIMDKKEERKMRKKFFVLSFILIFISGFISCSKKYSDIKDVFTVMPQDTDFIFALNISKGLKTEYIKEKEGKFIRELLNVEKNKKEYDDFVKETGIDPEKDINYIIGCGKDINSGVLIGVEHSIEKIKNYVKSKKINYSEIKYKNIPILKLNISNPSNNKIYYLSSLTDNLLIIGEKSFTEKIIDVFKGEEKSLLNNTKIMKRIDEMDTSSIAWGFFDFNNMLFKKFEDKGKNFGIETDSFNILLFQIDYNDSKLTGDFKILSNNPETNKKTVDILNGIKAMISMAKGKISELTNYVNFSSSDDKIILNFSIPRQFLDKLEKDINIKHQALNFEP